MRAVDDARRRANDALRRLPKWAVWAAGLIPLALLVADGVMGHLGVDPVRDIEHRLGRTAIYFLIASLMVTPVLRLAKVNAMRFRRTLGLLAFTYLGLHLVTWVALDMGLLWSQMAKDVVKRPYLMFGMGAGLILLAMALTSANAVIRRMGPRRWRMLHRLVYLAAPLAALHWLWALKVWEAWPLTVAAVILGLLAVRVPAKAWARGLLEAKVPAGSSS